MTFVQWAACGKVLSQIESAIGWIGDWWNSGDPYGERVDIVREQFSLAYSTVRQYGSVCKNVRIRLSGRLPRATLWMICPRE